ncbi:PA14 domain-containing protein [Geobacillus thermodenitrificans]|uniref:PA14 domain-containing protein n=1 Tax=Geobacillus thermodenitrificans TaxID=33940 RepID=UPI000D3A9D79|nr:PA14 domain-containing protein [Geobacillus thermodenitrificans]PTR48445.1 hypothetical protein CW755_02995 [Geobacillus thermodenitrificans]
MHVKCSASASGGTEWTAEFYQGRSQFLGTPIKKAVSGIHFNWGYSSPLLPSFPRDQFTVKFRQTLRTDGGTDYFVQTYADDGIRVKRDGEIVLDRWTNSAGRIDRALLTGLSVGDHSLEVDYYENGGKATVFADVVPLGHWLAYYYGNRELEGDPVNARVIEPQSNGKLYEDHGYDAPMAGVGANDFSARYVTAKRLPAGEYVLRTRADDGIRVYIDGNLVLDRWTTSNYQEDAVKIHLDDDAETRDVHWIEVQYFEKGGRSRLYVSIEPYDLDGLVSEDQWYAEYYPNLSLDGIAYV